MSAHNSLDSVIEDLEKAVKGQVPYSARLVMGTKGNLDGLSRRLPQEYPGEQKAIQRINTLIDALIHELEQLLSRNKETGGQEPAELEQELATESERRSQGQMTARRC